MKRKILLISAITVVTCSTVVNAQVGIGTTTPDSSSILHLNSTNKGLLITSISLNSLTDSSTIPSPATGLLVWNNGNGSLTTRGFYYWNNSQWNILTTGNSTSGGGSISGWNTNTGNSGTNAGSNTTMFVGTSTHDDLYFKVNNLTMGHLGVNDGINFGRSSNSAQFGVAMGYNANASSNGSTAVATNSTAIGDRSMAMGYNSKTQSNDSSAFGVNSTTQGDRSMAMGYNSKTQSNDSSAFGVNSIASGDRSMALGYNAKTQASDTSAFGINANALAPRSTAIGYNSQTQSDDTSAFGINANALGVRSIALGYNAKTQSEDGVALGGNTDASGIQSTALGFNAKSTAQSSTALGSGSSAGGQNSTAIGFGANTTQNNAIVLGNSSANVGIGTSTPNTSTKLDVNGQYKLGEKGSVHKNQISFEVNPSVSISGLQPGRTEFIDITIPVALRPNSTNATIVVSPANDFAGNNNFGISNPRMTSNSNIRINVTNIANGNQSLSSGHFFVTINEF